MVSQSASAPAATPTAVPPSIPFGDASRTAVFVLVDAEFAAASEWRRYAGSLVDDRGTSDLIVPITLTKPEHLPPPLQNLQAIRLDQTVEPHATTTLRSRVFHSLCRLMDPEARKVKVFLSHAKADGTELLRDVRRYLNDEAFVNNFFDQADIPDGAPFEEFLHQAVDDASILLAIQTDAYASREWCRLEVLEAKKRSVPIVVLAATEHIEARSFPYMGNVPVIRWTGRNCLPELVGALLREVLRTRYFPATS